MQQPPFFLQNIERNSSTVGLSLVNEPLDFDNGGALRKFSNSMKLILKRELKYVVSYNGAGTRVTKASSATACLYLNAKSRVRSLSTLIFVVPRKETSDRASCESNCTHRCGVKTQISQFIVCDIWIFSTGSKQLC